MRNKKLLLAFMSSAALLAAACNPGVGEQKQPEKEPAVMEPATPMAEPTPTEVPGPTEIPYRDLGGMEIIIGDYRTPEKESYYMIPEWNSLLWPYWLEIEKNYNVRIREGLATRSWDAGQEYISSIEKGTPIAQVMRLDYKSVAEPLEKGMFYDLATLDELDFSEEKWNDSVREHMTVGDSIYGMKIGVSESGGGVIFNKRLFEEAGLAPDLPYDLQATGEWTWSKFEELCKILTRDTDGDGQTDVYATVSQGAATIQCLVASTGSGFVEKDENGVLYNNLESEEVTDALNFAVELYQKGYEMPQPEESQWDYFVSAFQEGKAAMQFNEIENCHPSSYYGDQMEDKVGFVMPPKPDGAEHYHSYLCDDIMVIPSCYDAETAGNIAYAYNLYMDRLVAEDDWQDDYTYYFWNEEVVDGKKEYFPDKRAEETLQYFADVANIKQLNEMLVYGLGDEIGPDILWMYPFETVTPEEQVELIAEKWDALIEETNRGRGNADEE